MNKRKRRVSDIALQLFVEKGVGQTSIQDIIEKANISKGTFYNYFSSKNDCIAEILEGLRYDASQLRMELQVGKDETDRQVLIEQIAIFLEMNEKRNLNVLLESILNSNEAELRKLVLHHRIYELEWLADRFTEVYGESIRTYAFELSILFHGMMQHMLFALRMTNSSYSAERLANVILSYLEQIKDKMVKENTVLLDTSSLYFVRSKINRKITSKKELLEMADFLKSEVAFTVEQKDLFDAIIAELNRDRIRTSVLQSLIKPFQQLFVQTEIESQINNFTNSIWYFLRMK